MPDSNEHAEADLYSRFMESAPVHVRLKEVNTADEQMVVRCLSASSPDFLVKMFSHKLNEAIEGRLDDYELGRVYFSRGQNEEARECLTRALEKNDAKANRVMGDLYRRGFKDNKMALFYYDRAVKASEDHSLLEICGQLCLEMNDSEKAKVYFSLGVSAGISEHYQYLGDCCVDNNLDEEAINYYEKAVKGGHVSALRGLLDLYGKEGDPKVYFDSFIAGLSAKVKARTLFEYIKLRFGSGKFEQRQWEEERKKVGEALSLDPSVWEDFFRFFRRNGLDKWAKEIGAYAIKHGQKAHAALAEMFLEEKNLSTAEHLCSNGILAGCDRCKYVMASIYEKQGHLDDAINLYEKAADAGIKEAYLCLARNYAGMGKNDEAKRNFEYALMAGTDSGVYNEFIGFLIKSGDFERAKGVFVKAIESGVPDDELFKVLRNSDQDTVNLLCGAAINEGYSMVYLLISRLFVLEKDYKRAEAALKRVECLDETHLHLARLYCDMKKFDKAASEFKQALNKGIKCHGEFGKMLETSGDLEQAKAQYLLAIETGENVI